MDKRKIMTRGLYDSDKATKIFNDNPTLTVAFELSLTKWKIGSVIEQTKVNLLDKNALVYDTKGCGLCFYSHKNCDSKDCQWCKDNKFNCLTCNTVKELVNEIKELKKRLNV